MEKTEVLGSKERFSFGKNWGNFLNSLSEERIVEAENSLKDKLGIMDLCGKTFLDVGSGSGLFSLAAHRLGARVFSFDYDQDSVNCTQLLKEKYASHSSMWTVDQGSVLDDTFLLKFTKADIVYSWGVLHHTGNLYEAFNKVSVLVKPGGLLFISIYNDQGGASNRWKWVKLKYNQGNWIIKMMLSVYTLMRQWFPTFFRDLIKYKNPMKSWMSYGGNNRGMSPWYDIVDWVGGYPFEVAKPEEVFDFFKQKNFVLEKMKTCMGGVGCNEFVFKKNK
jgi:2-polyprenyl-6-hydroxyphenyl methylase/3-demethylubiquinone-9 3-methyltransferase